jgi:8-oxo-dGTP pyrophosphatase MutT (NUDIX family)
VHALPPTAEASRLDIRLSPDPLAFARREEGRIAATFAAAKARNPALFDGPILLFSRPSVVWSRLTATAFRTRYSSLTTLIAAPEAGRDAYNLFGAAAIVGSDGGVVLGRMGPRTAGAGEVKFPGGTPDEEDLTADGGVDILGSIAREMEEETGLRASEARRDETLILVDDHPYFAVVGVLRFPKPAAALAERIGAFLAADPEPELAGVEVVRPGASLDPAIVPAYTRAALARLA